MTRPAHTVIYTHGGGRLGNQIVRFAHWMAWTRAHAGVEVIDVSFWPFAHFFSVWSGHPGCVFPLRDAVADRFARWRAKLPGGVFGDYDSRLRRAVHALGHVTPGWQAIALDVAAQQSIDLDDPAFVARVSRRRVTTCSGWKIASWPMLAARQQELRTFFRPAERFARPAEEFMARVRARHDVVIGMLIRQSDYSVWNEGRFYFSTADYARWIRELVELHRDRRPAVVVASEDWQDPAAFAGLPVYLASGNPKAGGHWFENWVELSLSDVVVSAPSTFSATAAFAGGLPLWPIVHRAQRMEPDQVLADGMVGAARHPEFSLAVK